MLAWLRRRRNAEAIRSALVEADAVDLITSFGEQAYFVARDRYREERGGVSLDIDRPAGRWSA